MVTLGGNAELELVDSMDPFSEGIIFSVMPPKKSWRNISNLSGGEKTLSSLALVFALQVYKPTPMYFMDEIDAALDLSHTQHIGQLFRTRFKGSQFIVVSLKEGLFTNANVLFRTRFRDGTSVVDRTANRSTSTLYTQNRDREQEENVPPAGRRVSRK